jgi:hypothetical protein
MSESTASAEVLVIGGVTGSSIAYQGSGSGPV